MDRNDLKGVKPKPLDPIPHTSKPIPTHLDEVKNPGNKKAWKYHISDYWNMFWGIFSDHALSKLDSTHVAIITSLKTILLVIGFVVILFLFLRLVT